MALTTPPPAGSKLRGSTLSALILEGRAGWVEVGGDQNLTSNSIVLQNITDLVLPVVANASYEWEANIAYQAGTAADIVFAFTFPTLAAMDLYQLALITAAASDLDDALSVILGYASAALRSVGGRGLGTTRFAKFWGTLVTGANAGNLQAQTAQAAATVETEVIKAGGYMTTRRVA
jgi:hypothetical protein